MLKVLNCIQNDHDLWLVLLAALVCLTGCHTAVSLIRQAGDAAGRPGARRLATAWSWGAGITFGSAVWSTHFVAMLSYGPSPGAGLDVGLTLASLAVAIGGSLLAVAGLLTRPASRPGQGASPWTRSIAGGLLLGSTIFAMHDIGIRALAIVGPVERDATLAESAWIIGSAVAIAACRLVGRRPAVGAILLALAVCSLHFTAMAALTIQPFGPPPPAASTSLLAGLVAAVCLLILLPALLGALVCGHLSRRSDFEAGRLRQFADSTFEGILFHRSGTIRDVNAAFCDMVGQSPVSLIGRTMDALFTPASRPALLRALATGGAAAEMVLLGQAGAEISVELLSRGVERQAGMRQAEADGVVVVRDLTRRNAADRRIARLAHYDALTGVANRLRLHELLADAFDQIRAEGTGPALLWVDLDRFAASNDLFGYSVGDRLLAQVAVRLVVAAGPLCRVARVDGDAFAVLAPAAGREAAAALAARLLDVIADPFEIAGHRLALSCSIGIAVAPDDADSPAGLIANADLALSRAKQRGRANCCFFESEMNRLRQEEVLLGQDLAKAIANGELYLEYQPLFAAADLSLTGYEALLRWQHPLHGQISPTVFVPLAEASGTILAIGAWVLETACAEAAGWNPPYRIAVNLSPVQLRQSELAQLVAATLRRTGLDPARLELEVTEGILINDPEHAIAMLREMQQQGIRIALDDYGTGYSSLNYLRRFAFDKIKIDRSYVATLGHDPTAEMIAGSIMALGRGLDMTVTAEGVETEAQLALLRRQGCDHIQGFLLGRPAPVERLHHRIAAAPRALAPAA